MFRAASAYPAAARALGAAGALLLALAPAALGAPAPEPASTGAAAPAPALPEPMTAPEYRLGNPRARVTLVEYASDTCPHCARFGLEVFPEVRKAYIDTGKVLYIFRELPTPPEDLSAAGFLVARCAGASKYLTVVEALFRAQQTARNNLDFLMAGGRAGGLDEAEVKTCIEDPKAVKALDARVQDVLNKDKIASTPTFIVNGRRLPEGEKTLGDIKAALDPLLAPAAGSRRTARPRRPVAAD